MTMFTLQFDTDNAAFEHCEQECSRILRDIADKLDRLDGRSNFEQGKILDANGNNVGEWSLMKDV